MYLNAHSFYSFKFGTLSPLKLVELAAKLGVETLALTDINTTSGVFEFVQHCIIKGIKPIVGIEFRDKRKNKCELIGIAKNVIGYKELCEMLSYSIREQKEMFESRKRNANHTYFIYPFDPKKSYKNLKDNEFVGVNIQDIPWLFTTEIPRSKLVVLHSVTFENVTYYKVHKVLRAVDNNALLSKVNDCGVGHYFDYFMPPRKLENAFEAFPDIIRNTKQLADQCSFDFDFQGNKNKKTYGATPYDDKLLLEKLALDGVTYRYPKREKRVLDQIKHELEIIDQLGLSVYFLISWDIIRYAENRGFMHVGRGSGANSIVAYCLGITDVDPIELDLYFERFINKQRVTPPDFDLDFSWRDRDEIFDYIFKRYGYGRTALLGSYVTFKEKSITRELGKVFGLPKSEIDDLIRNKELPTNNHQYAYAIKKLEKYIAHFPSHLSIHAGGVLISDKDITNYTALENPPKGFQTTQFDMYVAEDIGLHKYDILSQRGLGHIKDTVDLIHKNKNRKIDIHDVGKCKKDTKAQQLLKEGKTIGCFYIESPAMRGLLQKLTCHTYLQTVAASSIIRPGVARSGMMKQFIYRFHNPEKFEYLHPKMKELLEETYGVMIYQEDVIKVAHHFGGLDLTDADILRRVMSGKKTALAHMPRLRRKFFENCESYGYPEEITKEVWRQMESFSGYSFSKAHSASYAVESFQSLYLKAHYPLEFMTAVINNFGGFYRTEVYVNEARNLGANISPPCVNKSNYYTDVKGKNLIIGLNHIKGLEHKIAKIIIEERIENGTFSSLENLVSRVKVTIESLILLIKSDAFGFTKISQKNLLWQAHFLLGIKHKKKEASLTLFENKAVMKPVPVMQDQKIEKIHYQIELLGFPLVAPFKILKGVSEKLLLKASELINWVGKIIKLIGYYVCKKDLRTVNKKPMAFGTWLDYEGNFFDTTHFSNVILKYPFQGAGFYLIEGKVVEDFKVPSIEVKSMRKQPTQPG